MTHSIPAILSLSIPSHPFSSYPPTISRAVWHFHQQPPHLRLDISVVIVLEQQRSRLCVIFAGRDVQGWEPDLALGVVLQQQGDHRVVALLESNGQWSEAILGEQGRETTANE